MLVLVQRVLEAHVDVEGETVGSIGAGLLLLVCFEEGDHEGILPKAVEKIRKLRVFEDENRRMNFDVVQSGGKVLSVSQFTLSWDGSGGHRPSFDRSLAPEKARLFYALFNRSLKAAGMDVAEGRFGADMKVRLINDGPVTFMLKFN